MRLLGIETSCDETAAAVIEVDEKKKASLLSSVIATSLSLHAQTGGIIPEDAARNQIKYIIPVIEKALQKANCLSSGSKTPSIDTIAVTVGPGLIGSLLVGVETAKTLASAWNKPIIPINHLFGHIYANWTDGKENKNPNTIPRAIKFPALALIVSGNHTDLVLMKQHGHTQWLGGTRDDAAGECFDKCARLLGYDYPGGPKIAQLAQKGNPKAFPFPRPMIGTSDYDFSFSGLKTAFLHMTKQYFPVLRRDNPISKGGWQQIDTLSSSEKHIVYDLCASLQQAIIAVLVKKTLKAAEQFHVRSIVLGGGVAANELLQQQMIQRAKGVFSHIEVFFPEKMLCTDNAAMIAAAAVFIGKQTPWQKITADPELYFD